MDSIRMVTWLAPGLPLPLFKKVGEALRAQLGMSVFLESRTKLSGPSIGSADPFAENRADLGFLCAPAAVPANVRTKGGFELLNLAPLFDDMRYANEPRCYCDIVVRRNTLGTNLSDLKGLVFGYNDSSSLSGWLGIKSALQTRNQRLETFFGSLVQTGGHLSSLDQLRDGTIQVASIDSNVIRSHPESLQGLRIIDSVGPWPAQPVVIRQTLDPAMKIKIKRALMTCGPWPQWGFVGFRPQTPEQLEQAPTAAVSGHD